MKNAIASAILGVSSLLIAPVAIAASGDTSRGQQVFRACAACHSLEPGKNMTGPSLSDLFGRKAGGLASFSRYSDPMKASSLTWNEDTLDKWIADPQHLIPDNQMPFAGIKDSGQRADLLAFLKDATSRGGGSQSAQGGGMGGMMGGGQVPNLKHTGPDARVQKITHCNDGYRVTTADGKTRNFWERNLRFKTDASEDGPPKDAPAIVGAGMVGDRADVIFAQPEEISATILKGC